jgi:hypothetical protein
MSVDRASLDKFGRFVMENLRDRCIDDCDRLSAAQWKAPRVQALQSALATFSTEQAAVMRRCFVACIDTAIHDFLFKLQERADFEDDIQVLVDGANVVGLSDGIHGESFGEDGWQARFSRFGQAPDEA